MFSPTHMLKELGEVEVLDDGVRMVPDPYNLSLLPLRYYIPYSYNKPFLAESHRNPFLYGEGSSAYYDDYPYGPYEGLFRHPSVRRDEYNEDDQFYDIYSHPAVRPVAIVPGDEYAAYYPASYPILSTVPFAATTAPIAQLPALPVLLAMRSDVQLLVVATQIPGQSAETGYLSQFPQFLWPSPRPYF
jgi:hypothetical protein